MGSVKLAARCVSLFVLYLRRAQAGVCFAAIDIVWYWYT